MRPGRRALNVAALAAGLALALAPTKPGTTEPGRAPSSSEQPASQQARVPELEGMFGFRVGEERWYGLEPVEVLRPGEFVRWRIRLDRIGNTLIDPIGVFVLENDTATFLSGGFNPGAKREISTRVELTVNRFGFPLEIDYDIDVADPTSRENRRERHFSFDADGFEVKAPNAMGFREFTVHPPNHANFDPSIPRGIFLSHSENPGLLSLVVAVLFAEGVDEFEYLAMVPSAVRGPDSRSRGRVRDFSRAKLKLEAATIVQVGRRQMRAIRADLNINDGDVFVEEDGTILRIDTRYRDRQNTYVRLLLPSEY